MFSNNIPQTKNTQIFTRSRAQTLGVFLVAGLALCQPAWAAPHTFASGMQHYRQGDYVTAAKHFNHCIEQDKALCDSMMGAILLKGKGMQADPKAAFEKVQASAWAGLPEAMFNLAEMHIRGVGTRKNERLAFEWFERSAENQYLPAMLKTSRFYELGQGMAKPDESMALFWLRRATSTNEPEALNYLAQVYETGRLGYEKDESMAMRYYDKAAKAGHTEALVQSTYLSTRLPGFAVEQAERVRRYTQAAERGSAMGLFYLGQEMEGIDRVQAYVLYGLALEIGHGLARKALDEHASKMTAYEIQRANNLLQRQIMQGTEIKLSTKDAR